MRNDTGEREAVPCLTVRPETKFKLFLQLRDTVKNIFLSSKQKKKSSLWRFIFLQHCVQNVPKMNKSEIKHAHCITRTPVRAFTWGEWIVVLGISAVIYFIQTHLNWNILKWELWSGRFSLVRATVVTTVCCVCFGHIVTTQVCFLFFFREPQISSLCFFYHVLNLLDWFASLATKTFSSKPFTLLLIIYKLVNFEEHNRQHIYEKNIKSSDQNKIQYLCGVETTFCGCALVQYRTNHRTWRDRTWTNSYNWAELDFDLFISPSVI